MCKTKFNLNLNFPILLLHSTSHKWLTQLFCALCFVLFYWHWSTKWIYLPMFFSVVSLAQWQYLDRPNDSVIIMQVMGTMGRFLIHWGRVMHMRACVSKLTSIGQDNGLSPDRRQAIIWTNAGIWLIGLLGTNFSEILIGIQIFSFKKMPLKICSAKWRPFCLGRNLNVLTTTECDQARPRAKILQYTLYTHPSQNE